MKEALRKAGIPCAASDGVDSMAAFRDLVARGVIQVLEERAHGAYGDSAAPAAAEATRGHHPPTVVTPRGNR